MKEIFFFLSYYVNKFIQNLFNLVDKERRNTFFLIILEDHMKLNIARYKNRMFMFSSEIKKISRVLISEK